MNTNNNILLTQTNSDLVNKGFIVLDEVFKSHGWHLFKNENNWISYTKIGNETSFVSVPVKNSIYQYVTTFKSYYDASEYVEQRFYDYIK